MKSIIHTVKQNPLLFWFGLFNGIAAIVLLLLPQADDRVLNGVSVWIKPAKFHITAAVYMWTMAVFLQLLPDRQKSSFISRLIALCMLVEVVLIDFQASRGVASHFNNATVWDTLIYAVMGVFIMINTTTALYTAIQFFRQSVSISAPMLWAIRLGIILFVIGSLQGGVMSAINQHSVGAADTAKGIFFLNWNREGGDLRIAHFVGVHALQLIPLFALGMQYIKRVSVPAVFAFSGVYLLIFTGVLVHALMGRPLF